MTSASEAQWFSGSCGSHMSEAQLVLGIDCEQSRSSQEPQDSSEISSSGVSWTWLVSLGPTDRLQRRPSSPQPWLLLSWGACPAGQIWTWLLLPPFRFLPSNSQKKNYLFSCL